LACYAQAASHGGKRIIRANTDDLNNSPCQFFTGAGVAARVHDHTATTPLEVHA
jgi:hypothetical protein